VPKAYPDLRTGGKKGKEGKKKYLRREGERRGDSSATPAKQRKKKEKGGLRHCSIKTSTKGFLFLAHSAGGRNRVANGGKRSVTPCLFGAEGGEEKKNLSPQAERGRRERKKEKTELILLYSTKGKGKGKESPIYLTVAPQKRFVGRRGGRVVSREEGKGGAIAAERRKQEEKDSFLPRGKKKKGRRTRISTASEDGGVAERGKEIPSFGERGKERNSPQREKSLFHYMGKG